MHKPSLEFSRKIVRAMEHRNYVVRQSARDWVVELDGQVVSRAADRGDAIAAATTAASEFARREFTLCRVSLLNERGCFPLTVFGSRFEHQQKLMKQLSRRWVDAA